MRTAMASFLALNAAVIGTFADKVLAQEGNSVALAFSGDFLGVRSVPEANHAWFAVNQTQAGMALSGLSLRLESGASFGFQAYGSAVAAVGEVRVTDYEIRLYQGTHTQTLAEFPRIDWDGPPQVVWARDMDRDGGPDALLDLRTHYSGHHYVLFLSSGASDGQLVSRVAEFRVGGC